MLFAYFGIIVLALNSIEGAQVSKKYTLSETGCVCWFDLEGIIHTLRKHLYSTKLNLTN